MTIGQDLLESWCGLSHESAQNGYNGTWVKLEASKPAIMARRQPSKPIHTKEERSGPQPRVSTAKPRSSHAISAQCWNLPNSPCRPVGSNLASVPNIHRINDHNIDSTAATLAASTPTPLPYPKDVAKSDNTSWKLYDAYMCQLHKLVNKTKVS